MKVIGLLLAIFVVTMFYLESVAVAGQTTCSNRTEVIYDVNFGKMLKMVSDATDRKGRQNLRVIPVSAGDSLGNVNPTAIILMWDDCFTLNDNPQYKH